MGKAANQQAWNEFQRIDRQRQEASFESDPPLTEEEKAAAWDDAYWERLDAVARYAVPVRVALRDEVRRLG